MAIEFSVDSKDLLNVLKPLFAGRARGKSAALDYVDIKAQEGEVEFVSTGMSSSLEVEVACSGCARVPFPLFEGLFRNPVSIAAGLLLIRITEGQIQVGPTTLNHPGVTIQAVEGRIADLPIDASLADALALSYQFTPKEITDSGLWARFQSAREEASNLIDDATRILEPLRIDRDSLSRFVFDEIKRRVAQR